MPTSIHSLNYDILLEIFHELSLHAISGPYSPERRERVSVAERVIRRQTLAGAALVCRAFADPATKVLWSSYFNGNMRILLELLSVCKKIPNENRRGKVYSLDGDISPDEWAVFVRCAARVRYIHEPCPNSSPIPHSVFETLSKRAGETVLFPGLKHLTWNFQSNMNRPMSKIPLVLASPAVSAVHIRPSPSNDTLLCDALSSLAETLPWLEEIMIWVCRNEDVLSPLLAFRNLRTIIFISLPCQHLFFVSALPRLEELRCGIEIDGRYKEVDLAGEEPRNPFRATKTLHLTHWKGTGGGFGINQVSCGYKSTLAYLGRGSFICASLPLQVAQSTNDIPLTMKTFCSPSLCTSLRSLDVTVQFAVDHETFIQITFGDAFYPLFDLRGLVELKLTTDDYIVSMTNEDVAHMAVAWPSIEVLYIDPRWSTQFGFTNNNLAKFVTLTRPSILALVDLAQQCPNLEVLGIHIADVTEPDLDALRVATRTAQARAERPDRDAATAPCEAEAEAPPPRPKLSKLNLSGGTPCTGLAICDVSALASALSTVFPDLEGTGVLKAHERRALRRSSRMQVFDDIVEWRMGRNNNSVDVDALMLELDIRQARKRRERPVVHDPRGTVFLA